MNEREKLEAKPVDHTKRDSETFLMLGGFLAILATIVLIATIVQDPGHARVVNGVAGIVLFLIGAGMFLWGYRLRGRIR
ncbi:MAG TPA: hypothetical protein PLJ47_11720 [Candidatus Hydrogenedentes bacterium]|nr:hypothetical protein [Candidatus Hydrogenedentota bacterium]